MDMNLKQDHRQAEWPGQAGGRQRRGGVAEPRAARPDKDREPIFDVADFEAIAVFAGLRPPPAQAG